MKSKKRCVKIVSCVGNDHIVSRFTESFIWNRNSDNRKELSVRRIYLNDYFLQNSIITPPKTDIHLVKTKADTPTFH